MSGRWGFTLLELMVGVFIFSLVIGSIYFTLRVGVESFHRGEESMRIYQSVRIGLEQLGRDLRGAVSPESPWSNLVEDQRKMNNRRNLELPEDTKPKESDIVFMGDSRQVTFVLQEVIPGSDPLFDLREVRYSVNQEDKILIRQAQKSLVTKRMMDWRSRRFEENETGYRVDYGDSFQIEAEPEELIRDVKDVQFQYFDGEEWRDSWDSNELIGKYGGEYDYNDPAYLEEGGELIRIGLPHAVNVLLTLSNGDSVRLTTDIPAKDVDKMANETEFAAYFHRM
jgi:prepilin-type N-terminal cleavage/methylation domain-containing protein